MKGRTGTPTGATATSRRALLGGAALAAIGVATERRLGSARAEASPVPGARRPFVDDTGADVEIPVRPERVVALDDRSVEAVLGVGAPLVGLVGRYAAQPVPPAFADRAEGAEFVGVEPNLEAIARLDPDLIVAQGFSVEGIDAELRRIAPLVVLEHWADETYTVTKWEEHFRRVAEAVGRPERAAAELARFDEAIRRFREGFPGDPAAVELSVVHLQPEQWFVFTPLSFPGEVVERLGFSRPEAQRRRDTDRVYLSYEELPLADGDTIVQAVDAFADGATEAAAELAAGPVWQSLGAVEAGRIHLVDGFLWLTAGSVLAGLALIDDLEDAFDVRA